MQMTKKGQAISLSQAPRIALILALLAMITGAGALALASFSESQCSGYWDGAHCWTDTNANVSSMSIVNNISGQGLTSVDNMSSQFGTIGTVVGVALIIAVVIGAFAFFIGGRSNGL